MGIADDSKTHPQSVSIIYLETWLLEVQKALVIDRCSFPYSGGKRMTVIKASVKVNHKYIH